MDLVTQGILGAAVSQVGFQKTLGRRALLWGAIIGMLPDADVFVRLSSNPFAEMLHHRGITHSLWFGPMIGPILGYLIWRFYKAKEELTPLSAWTGLSIWALLTHPLLDVFTVYGTQLLAPFSNHRFTFPAIAIIDPVYSGILLIAISIGFFFHRRLILVITSAAIALTLTTCYLFLGLAENTKAKHLCQQSLKETSSAKIKVYPTMFQLFLRRVVVEEADQLRFGFISTWSPRPIEWTYLEKPKNLPSSEFLKDPEVEIFKWFTSGQYAIKYDESLHQITMIDTRFGFEGPSIFGLWGVTFLVDQKGDKISSAQKIKYPIGPITGSAVLKLFQKAFN
ncbi:MAG: metal-dependent hydrolase [Alphaproteobacteria bacterium]|nr:metal-dependent hydrolase [Alphaproteobacteria bacterium]